MGKATTTIEVPEEIEERDADVLSLTAEIVALVRAKASTEDKASAALAAASSIVESCWISR